MRKVRRPKFFFSLSLLLVLALCASVASAANVKWRLGSVFPPSLTFIETQKHWAKLVDQLSSGEIKIKVFSAGELVPPFETFDAVSKGTLEAGGDWPNFWAGKDTAFDLLGSFPMALTPVDYIIWIYQGGGLELYQEVYGKFGMYYLPTAVTPMESGVRSQKPINTLDDYKGLKIRMSGQTQGKMLQQLGAAQTMLAISDIYQALDKGLIDAAEFSSPDADWSLGLAEVTKYWATPGWHQPSSCMGIMINKKVWDELPETQKEILKDAAMATLVWSYSWLEYNSIDATKKFLDKGITLTRLSDDDLNNLQRMANNLMMEGAEKNPLFAKVAYSQCKWLKDVTEWRSISMPFTYGRNPVELPDLARLKELAEKAK